MESDKPLTSEHEPGHDLHLEHEDPTIRFLHRIIHVAVKILAVLMVLVIVWGIALANKTVRSAYAMLKRGEDYRPMLLAA